VAIGAAAKKFVEDYYDNGINAKKLLDKYFALKSNLNYGKVTK